MKRLIIQLITLLFVVSATFAQSDSILYRQDFENYQDGDMIMIDNDGLIPHYSGLETWIVYHGHAISSSWYENGDRTADDWMITPPIQLSAHPAVMWDAYTPLEQYRDGYQVLVTTDTAHPDSLSHYDTVFSISAENTTWTTRIIDLSQYANQAVRIAWRNNSTDEYLLYVDNIVVFERPERSIALLSCNLSPFMKTNSPIDLSLKVRNYGVDTIHNLKISYSINGQDTITANLNRDIYFAQTINLPLNQSLSFNADTIYNVKIWVSSLNDQLDTYNQDDTISYTVAAWDTGYRHITLVEHFTQASCGPCAQQNPQLNDLLAQNQGKVIHIAYHTSWPGTDPMYDFNPEESDARVAYYGVTGVPHVVIDGTRHGQPNLVSQTLINTNYAKFNALFKVIFRTASTKDQTFNFEVLLIPTTYIVRPLHVRVVWIEDKTYSSPPGSNGETNFPDVMRKMFPDADGFVIDSVDKGDTIVLPISYTVTSQVNPNNSQLVVFVQDDQTKQVLTARQKDVLAITKVNPPQFAQFKIFPNPATEFVYIDIDQKAKIQIFNQNGQLVKSFDINSNGTHYLNIKDLTPGVYLIKANTSTKTLTQKLIKL